MYFLPISQVSPFHSPSGHVQLLGGVQFPPFKHSGLHIA